MKTTKAKAIKLVGRVTGMVMIAYGWTKVMHAYDDLRFYALALAGESSTTTDYAADMVRHAPDSIHLFGLYLLLGVILVWVGDFLAQKVDG